MPPGYTVYMTSAIRRRVKLPVIAVGRIKDPNQAEQILAQGHADLIGMVRALIADPELPNKALNGQEDSIRMCLSCNQDCIGRVGINRTIGCVQNPGAGKEKVWGIGTLRPASKPKRVLVIGGGPAGMEAARVSSLRGHHVILMEKEAELGGQVNVAAKLPYRAEFGDVTRNLVNAINGLEIDLRLSCEATPEGILKEGPDAVIVATGSCPQRPATSGCDQDNVFTVWEVLTGNISLGERVLIIDQVGFYQASGVAEQLSDQGKSVEVLSPSLYVGQNLGGTLDLEMWYQRSRKKGITLSPNYTLVGIEGNTVRAIHNYSGQVREWQDVDNVVLAAPHQANEELYFALKGKVAGLYRIGDCLAPRRVDSSIREGHRIGRIL
jgi:2,4-dienoyl-CoA reductase (NADPH2)